MAGLLGEGGIVALSGTCNSASPATLADFRYQEGDHISKGPDGRACNIYQVIQNDTGNTMLVKVRATGLQENNTTSGAIAFPLIPLSLQNEEDTNGIALVQAWPVTLAGADLTSTATANSVMVSGMVVSRRG
jgi:hypothetical protein